LRLFGFRNKETTQRKIELLTIGHSKVDLAMNVYDKASAEDIRAGLRVVSKKLLGSDLLPKGFATKHSATV